jgi:hypothetical protein
LAEPEVLSRLNAGGILAMALDRAQMGNFIPQEVAKWQRLAREANIQPE